jgi:alkanesulfonate monooxygenase
MSPRFRRFRPANGSSQAAGPVAAKYADDCLTWGEPLAAAGQKLRWVEALAARENRTLRFGIRLHGISRDTADEAWRQAARLIERVDDEMIAKVQQGLEEAHWSGAGVLPVLAARGVWRHPAPDASAPRTITPFAPARTREPTAAP